MLLVLAALILTAAVVVVDREARGSLVRAALRDRAGRTAVRPIETLRRDLRPARICG